MADEENTIKVMLTFYRKMALLKRMRRANPQERLYYVKEVFVFNGLDPKIILDVDLRTRQNEIYLMEADAKVTIQKKPQESGANAFKRLISDLRHVSDLSVAPCSESLLDLMPDLHFGQSCNIRLQSMSFGTIIKNKYIRHSQIISSAKDDPVASFKLDAQRTMELYFLLGQQLHCMELKYKRDIDTKIIVCNDNESTRIYFQLLLSPKIYLATDGSFQFTKNQQMMSTNISPKKYVNDEEELAIDVSWNRMRDFPGCSAQTLGFCTALELKVSDDVCPKDKFMSFFKELMERQYTICFGQFEATECNNYTRRWDDIFAFVEALESPLAFNVCWALKVLHSKGYIAIDYVENHLMFWTTIKEYAVEDPEQLELALYKIASILDDDRYIDLYQALLDNFKDKTLKQKVTDVDNTKKIRACYVTPTRLMFFEPMDMLENRILLDYDPEFCLRVTYRDDDMTRINAKNIDFYDSIIRSSISNCIKVHKREFQFLACSNSQLRTHGVWFYAKDLQGNTASIVRSELGNFSGIDCIATFVARMGQCFSTSVRAITSIKKCGIEKREKDIMTEDGKYNFSDGTGRISKNFAQMLCENLKKKCDDGLPSLFQIRYGGCKGTVSVDNTLEGNVIVIRDSMAKFKCEKDDLEIVKIAGPSPLHLNHQSIMLLEHHGVPQRVFLRIQEKAVETELDMLLNEQRAAKELDARATMKRPLNHKDLHIAGLSLTTDPYFRKVLKLILHNSLRKVKCEGHIRIPTDMGRNLMGCMDEYRVLEYGEVHVKIKAMKTDTFNGVKTITGPVIVTKFPAVHPGDMRRFTAVEKPELSHLVDCIVFPQKGHRPHPSEMAGSDLDGDEYFVTWLPEFLKNFAKENVEPLTYAPAKKLKLGRDIVATDMYQFISDYIKNDQLGKIANAHKAIGDREGLNHKLAVKLSEKFSVAVDFAKTGECPSLEPEEQIQEYPDFMQKHDVSTVYESRRALGTMYRKVSLLDDLLEQSVDAKDVGVNWEQIHYTVNDKKKLKEAKKDYGDYCHAVHELMHLYGVQTEAELISGNVTQFHRRFMEKEDMFATSKIVKKRVMSLRDDFRKRFFVEFKVNPDDIKTFHITDEMIIKSELWHRVAYYEPLMKSKGETQTERILSFPWVVSDILSKLIAKTVRSTSLTSPCIDKITASIMETYRRNIQSHLERSQNSDYPPYIALVSEYPAILPLFYILDCWCKTIHMRPMFVTVVEMFLKFLDLPDVEVTMDLIDAVTNSSNLLADINTDMIGQGKVGQIIVNFMKKLGSQNFVSSMRNPTDLKPIRQSADKVKLATHALRAYFSLAVDNTCRQLTQVAAQVETAKKKHLYKEKTVVIPKALFTDIYANHKTIIANFERLAKKNDLDLREVLINKRRRRKHRVGTLFFRGSHKTVHLLCRVATMWLKNFEKQEDGDYYMVFFKRFSEICY